MKTTSFALIFGIALVIFLVILVFGVILGVLVFD